MSRDKREDMKGRRGRKVEVEDLPRLDEEEIKKLK